MGNTANKAAPLTIKGNNDAGGQFIISLLTCFDIISPQTV